MMRPPSREEVMRRLGELATGSASPSEIANWAMDYFRNDDAGFPDGCVLDALDVMGGADLLVPSGELLYSLEDFQSWLDEFRACCG